MALRRDLDLPVALAPRAGELGLCPLRSRALLSTVAVGARDWGHRPENDPYDLEE